MWPRWRIIWPYLSLGFSVSAKNQRLVFKMKGSSLKYYKPANPAFEAASNSSAFANRVFWEWSFSWISLKLSGRFSILVLLGEVKEEQGQDTWLYHFLFFPQCFFSFVFLSLLSPSNKVSSAFGRVSSPLVISEKLQHKSRLQSFAGLNHLIWATHRHEPHHK